MLRVLAAAIEAVDAGQLVTKHVEGIRLPAGKIYALALGKAALPMAEAVAAALPVQKALVITKHARPPSWPNLEVLEAGHPIPDRRSLAAGRAALRFVASLTDADLLICLISGGGSALAVSPVPGVSLRALQSLTVRLMAGGASIEEINAVRRQLDLVKDGGLALATRARVLSLILSDVAGGTAQDVASGPTVLSETSGARAAATLQKYGIQVPNALAHRRRTSESNVRSSASARIQNTVIGSTQTAIAGGLAQAVREGYAAEALNIELNGEASDVGRRAARVLHGAGQQASGRFCLIAGGETTVTLSGPGTGGRNQELALAAVRPLSGSHDVMLIALATDGEEAATDAAGAVVTGASLARAEALRMRPEPFLAANDSYSFFSALGDLLKPGPTFTNVADLLFLIGHPGEGI